MITNRKQARQVLDKSTLNEFNNIVLMAKIKPHEIEMLRQKFILGKSNTEIAFNMNLSVERVNHIIGKVYEKVAKLL